MPEARTRWILAAASVLIAMLVGMGVWWHLKSQQFSSGIGERRTVALTDGSWVSLDASSEVRVRYSAGQRVLHLVGGRAKFDVARDPLRPFRVYAADREIEATGTAFSVEIVAKEVRVIVYEGRVRVVGPGHVGEPLSPGQELIGPISMAQAHIEPVDASRSLSWQSGQLEFVDEPLASAVERVNRYTSHSLSVNDPSAAALRISGVFSAGDTRAFVEGVTAVYPLEVEVRNGRNVLETAARTHH